jgi:sugar/nucleoside kinase (ribokinase family)
VDKLKTFFKREPREINVVVMPDFFLDRIINLEYDSSGFSTAVAEIAKRKGGSIDGVAQTDLRGGNAVNTASALAALGVNVTPIICSNKRGQQLLRYYLKSQYVDLSRVKVLEKASLTTALELKGESGKANVMLRDLGSLADFGCANLTDSDYEAIEMADYVCLFNWAGTRRNGTELARNVFQRVKAKGKGKTYFDTADPTPNREKIPELMENILKTKLVDVMSLNENEAVTYASLLSNEVDAKPDGKRFDELALDSARLLAKRLPARIDLHTTAFSATFTKKAETVVPAFKIKPLRATGAGDAWNAGNILGDSSDLSSECRLTLANAVAACYVSSLAGSHPTREQLIRFLERHEAPEVREKINWILP